MKTYMRSTVFIGIFAAFVFGLCILGQVVSAEETAENGWDTFEVMPVRFINVKGDAAKFRALNWMDDGATGGIKSMRYHDDLGKAGTLTFEGHGIAGDNNYGGKLDLKKDEGGYMTLQYDNFRKYYDVYGGYFGGFAAGTSPVQKLDIDPAMDIGNFFFEIGSSSNVLETVPGISLSYQRRTKEGTKSFLEWGSATDGALTRKITPSTQEQSLVTDTITLKGNTDVGGFNINGEQRVEFLNGRIYQDVVNSATTSQSKEYNPQAKHLMSTLQANRWLVDDKTYVGFAYRFQHSRHDADILVSERVTATGAVNNDSHNRDGEGKAYTDSHSWVEHFTTQLTKQLNMVAKLKQEVIASSGSGFGVGYTTAGDVATESENKVTRLGESISLRYSGIPKTSLYTDWDFQQTHNWLWRTRITTGQTQTEYLDTGPQTTGVVGARYVANSKVNTTFQYRYNKKRDNFDSFFNNDNGITISRFNFTSHELSSRVSWKPLKWFENSLRLQLGNTVYRVRNLGNFTTSPDWVKSQADSLKLTYNAVAQLWDAWMFDVGYQMNNFKVSTPATQFTTTAGGIPTYYANVHTWLMSASYAPTKDLSVFTSGQYSLAHNFDDKSFAGIPYGLEFDRYDVNIGLQWTPKEDIAVKPSYAYYSYRADDSLDFGSYSAHVVWLDLKYKW